MYNQKIQVYDTFCVVHKYKEKLQVSVQYIYNVHRLFIPYNKQYSTCCNDQLVQQEDPGIITVHDPHQKNFNIMIFNDFFLDFWNGFKLHRCAILNQKRTWYIF